MSHFILIFLKNARVYRLRYLASFVVSDRRIENIQGWRLDFAGRGRRLRRPDPFPFGEGGLRSKTDEVLISSVGQPHPSLRDTFPKGEGMIGVPRFCFAGFRGRFLNRPYGLVLRFCFSGRRGRRPLRFFFNFAFCILHFTVKP